MERVYEWLVGKCKTEAQELVPDIQFDCWQSSDAGLCQEATCLWECVKSDLGDTPAAMKVAELLQCMSTVARLQRQGNLKLGELDRVLSNSQHLKDESELLGLVEACKAMAEIEEAPPIFTVFGTRYVSLVERVKAGNIVGVGKKLEISQNVKTLCDLERSS
jgi:hypothetical protein